MQQHASAEISRHPLWLLAAFWFCVAIAVVLRRLVELIHPSHASPPHMASLDATFSSHAALTVMHIIPAAVFVLLSAAVLLRRAGGWVERSAVLVFNTWFLFSPGRAYSSRLRGDSSRKREWMIRAAAILLGIATTRPLMGVFFVTSSRTHLSPRQFFGIAFWIGFSINAGVIELWLHSKRRAHLHQQFTEVPDLPGANSVFN